jgi:5-methylthioadenosine/S-adenosylhomocysteine deaminase
VKADDAELSLGTLDAGLVYAASGSIVDTTVINGRVLMRGGIVEGESEIVTRARRCAEGLGIR